MFPNDQRPATIQNSLDVISVHCTSIIIFTTMMRVPFFVLFCWSVLEIYFTFDDFLQNKFKLCKICYTCIPHLYLKIHISTNQSVWFFFIWNWYAKMSDIGCIWISYNFFISCVFCSSFWYGVEFNMLLYNRVKNRWL